MRILLVRHAKSAHPGGVRDHDRPLSERGVGDATAVGRWLAGSGAMPERVVSSTALRAAETARLITAAAAPGVTVEHDPDLYGASVSDVLGCVAADTTDTMVVGHEPTLSTTVAALCGATVAMVTTAVACVEVPDSRPVREGSGVLRWLMVPRLVRGERA